MKPPIPKHRRVAEFLARLEGASAAKSAADAKQLIDTTLNDVENEFTDIPFDPDNWRTDGRLYPAHEDSASEVDGFPNVTRFRSKGHETFIGANGAYEIHDLRTKQVVHSKPGTDGRGVWL